MPYDLFSRGLADFTRLANVLDQVIVSRDPLSGVLDGANLTFHTTYFPILTSGSLGVYTSGSLIAGVANYDTGEVTLASPPNIQPEASYTLTPYTAKQLASFVIQGFLEMESVWTRGWQLLDGTGAWADESSANAYVVDTNGSDPVCGPTVFSNSRIQVGFLMACCEFRMFKTQFRAAAGQDFMWRESVRGMTIDKSKRPANMKLAVDSLHDELMLTLSQAQIQFYPGGDQFGGAILNPATLKYIGDFEWQSSSISNNNWSFAGYNVAYRPLTYFP